MGLIFAEFVTYLKSPKINKAKNKPYYTSLLTVLEIVKIGLMISENLTHLPSVIFAKFPDTKNSRYTVCIYMYLPHGTTAETKLWWFTHKARWPMIVHCLRSAGVYWSAGTSKYKSYILIQLKQAAYLLFYKEILINISYT